MKIKPLHDRVIVKRSSEDEKTRGGLYIPESAKETPVEGKVLAVGPGRRDDNGKLQPLDVKVGDRVIVSKYGGTDVKYDGEEYVIMREEDILGIIVK
ncbi:MAG: co-chaperone GroES [Deltaproteobacteria bacterium]|nr:co-chaperone GroES [Deltaproteobacteria bacterium]